MSWITMRNAYEIREEFDTRGRRIKREITIGASVPWMITTLVIIGTGKIPPSLLEFLQSFR